MTGTITIDIVDDVPQALAPAGTTVTNTAGSMSLLTTLDTRDGDVDNDYGADGPGAVIFTDASIAALEAQNLQSGFTDLVYTLSPDKTVITATKVSDSSEVFRIELQPTGGADQYQVTISQPLDSTSVIDFNGGNYNFVGGNNSWNGFVPNGEVLGGTTIDNDSQDLLLTPAIGGADGSSVNTTATIGGIGNTFVGPQDGGETFRVDFVTDLRGDTADSVGGQAYAAPDNRDHVFDGHYTVNGATALFKSTSGSTVRITAFDDPDGNNIVGDGTIDAINGVTIAYRGVGFGSVIIPTSTPTEYTVNGQVFTVTLNGDGSVSVAGVEGDSGSSLIGTVIGVLTPSGYNSVEYSWEAGSTFQVGDFGATTITNDPVDFSVPISIRDGDGDVTDAGTLNITAAPGSPPVVLDLDGDGVELLGLDAGVAYDMDSDGVLENTAWFGPDDGMLVFDADGDGTVSGASEFQFGSGSMTDLEAVAARFDTNGDGVLDTKDAQFASFGIWQDADSDGVADAGELASLGEMRIASISLVGDGAGEVVAGGDANVHGHATYTRTDGSTGTLADVSFRLGQEQRATDAAIASAAMAGFLAGAPIAAAGVVMASAMPTDTFGEFQVIKLSGKDQDSENTLAPTETVSLLDPRSSYESNDQVESMDPDTQQQTLDNPLAESGSPEPAAEIADPVDIEASSFSFADGGSADMGAMEALLTMQAPVSGAAASNGELAQAAIADALAGQEVETIIDNVAQSDAPAASAGEVDGAAIVQWLQTSIDGHSIFTGTTPAEVSVDEMAQTALLHA